MKIIMNFWDCKTCGHKHIGGNQMSCPSCGTVRGKDTTFYMDSSESAYLDADEAKKIMEMGEDWCCSYCGSMNRGNQSTCASCGAERKDASGTYDYREASGENSTNTEYYKNNTSETDNQSTSTSNIYNTEDEGSQFTTESSYKPSFYDTDDSYQKNVSLTLKEFIQNYANVIGIVCIWVFVLAFLIYGIIPKWKTATVMDKTWDKEIDIEIYKTLHQSAWSSGVPADARITNQVYTYKTTIQVYDHTETYTEDYQSYEPIGSHTETYTVDLGNGYSGVESRQVTDYGYVTRTRTKTKPVYRSQPVYDWLYYYDVDRWVYERSLYSDGTYLDTEFWPDVLLEDDERVGDEIENYTITLKVNKKEQEYEVEKSIYNSVSVNKSYNMKLSSDSILEVKGITDSSKVSGFK